MPANYDMIISQSPPSIFSHSPPAGFLTDYMSSSYRRPFEPPGFSRPQHHLNHYSHFYQPSPPVSTPNNAQRSYLPMKSINALQLKMASAPKSCLAKHDHSSTDSDETDCSIILLGPQKSKRVVFADDKGLALTQVKVMSEPSNVPPYWTLQFLAEVTHGLVSPVAITEEWVVDFKQPASDYLEFRRILEEKKVSLENVIVRESESIVVGTVKVRNLSFDKEVVVRVTYDKWKTQEDIQCTYSNLGGPGAVGGAYALFDTFSFKLTLPPSSKRSVEFCVCFRCNGQEYWDSNNGQNYTLSKRINGTATSEKDSILANPHSVAKMNEVTTIIQDLKSSWSSGVMADSLRPYW